MTPLLLRNHRNGFAHYDRSSTVGVVVEGDFGRKSLFFNGWVWRRGETVVPQSFLRIPITIEYGLDL